MLGDWSCVEMAFTVLSPPSRCVTSVTRPEAACPPMPTLLWCYTFFSRGLHLSSLCSKRYPQGLCPLQNWAVSEPLPLLACCSSVVKFPTFPRCVGINTLVFHSILITFKINFRYTKVKRNQKYLLMAGIFTFLIK